MQILPVALATAKEKYSNFFVFLVNVYLKSSTLRFAVVDQDIEFNGISYTAFPVQIGAIKSVVDNKRNSVDITISDCTDAFKIALLSGEDFRGRTMEILRISYPESLTDNSAYEVTFRGQIDSPKIDDGESKFTCVIKEPLSNYDCGRTLMLSCNARFADIDDCGATKNTASGIVQSGSTATIVNLQSSYSDDYWKYGHITINGQTIQIQSSSGTQVVTEYPFYIIPTGAYVLESGCSKTFYWCGSRYSNKMNFSGAPATPFELQIKT